MSIKDFCTMMKTLELPFAHFEFSNPTSAPCMVYLVQDGESIHADSRNVLDGIYIRLEVYCKPTDLTTVKRVEELLFENHLTYERNRTWISERKEVMYVYDICI